MAATLHLVVLVALVAAGAAADALVARAHAFEGYSPAPLGFPSSDLRVSCRLDDVEGGKALHCERRSGSASEIKTAYKALVALFKPALPRDWTFQEEGDLLNAYPPGPNASVAVGMSWADRDPGLFHAFRRGTPPRSGERYVLTLVIFPPAPPPSGSRRSP